MQGKGVILFGGWDGQEPELINRRIRRHRHQRSAVKQWKESVSVSRARER